MIVSPFGDDDDVGGRSLGRHGWGVGGEDEDAGDSDAEHRSREVMHPAARFRSDDGKMPQRIVAPIATANTQRSGPTRVELLLAGVIHVHDDDDPDVERERHHRRDHGHDHQPLVALCPGVGEHPNWPRIRM